MSPQFLDPRLPDRFWAKVQPCPMNGCWLWTGAEIRGYGSFGHVSYHTTLAHRHSYSILVGPIPDGLHLDHLCRTPCCVNPSHLEPVTNRENTLRGRCAEVNRARLRSVTHCPRGHEYTPDTTYLDRRGRRDCKACWPEESRRARSRREAHQ